MSVLWVVLGLLVALFLYGVVEFNRLVRHRNRVENAWSGIDVQLRRRYDLIPNLVEAVKGYAAHERELFEKVTKARARGIDATSIGDQAQAESEITRNLRQLMAVAEAYPELKANENFLALQEELTATESKIAFARQFYNEQVLAYDNAIEVFPTNLIAGMFNFEPRPYFEIEQGDRANVAVDFGTGGGGTAPPAATPPAVPPASTPPGPTV